MVAAIESTEVTTIEDLITSIRLDYGEWSTETTPWFRGERISRWTAVQPKLYRKRVWRNPEYENRLLQQFRMKAPSLGLLNTPPRGHTDEWLFLAQHVGLPTRLLDWTEGLFVALHFALLEKHPVVWMLDPIALNRLSTTDPLLDNVFSLTWFSPGWSPLRMADLVGLKKKAKDDPLIQSDNLFDAVDESMARPGLGNINIKAAWEQDKFGSKYPVAIHPTNIHDRMSAQKSCFTVHGTDKRSLALQVDSRILRKYVVPSKAAASMQKDLQMMGVTHSTVYPDLDGLARDLAQILP